MTFAKELHEFGSGQPVRRLSLFDHLERSPESGSSRQLITNANRYGLIKGSYAAELLELTNEGQKATADHISPRERSRARISLAIEGVEPFKGLYEKFKGNKLPARGALIDAIKDFGVTDEAAEEAIDTFIVNLRYVGLLQTLSGAERIVTTDHLFDQLPSTDSPEAQVGTHDEVITKAPGRQVVTAAHAQFERTAFYVAPIGDEDSEERKHSDLFLGSIIEPALEKFELDVIRADAIEQAGIITKQVIEYLLKSRLVIVDLSFHNPNVFYELAIRHMMRRPVVQVVRTADKVPFDINQVRTVRIDTTDIYTLVPKIDTYRSEIANQVRRALQDADAVDNPISIYFPSLQVPELKLNEGTTDI